MGTVVLPLGEISGLELEVQGQAHLNTSKPCSKILHQPPAPDLLSLSCRSAPSHALHTFYLFPVSQPSGRGALKRAGTVLLVILNESRSSNERYTGHPLSPHLHVGVGTSVSCPSVFPPAGTLLFSPRPQPQMSIRPPTKAKSPQKLKMPTALHSGQSTQAPGRSQPHIGRVKAARLRGIPECWLQAPAPQEKAQSEHPE